MPLLRGKAGSAPIVAPVDWRPQKFGRRNFRSIAEPIIEPQWRGVRVIARVNSGLVNLADEDAVDCTAEFPAVAEAVGSAALADELVLDGYLTFEATQKTTGVTMQTIDAPSAPEIMGQLVLGSHRKRPVEPEPHLDPNRPIAFVAVDLLAIDGTLLIDLPLLERKRLLDGALRAGELVRITPFVRPPAESFITTWQALGFHELAYKAANSRYLPGDRNEDWATVPIPRR